MYCSLVDELALMVLVDHLTRKTVGVGCIKTAWQFHIQSNGICRLFEKVNWQKKSLPLALYYQHILQILRRIAIRGDALQDLDCTPKFSALLRRHRVRDQKVRQESLMLFY